ncbi:MAG: C40 family peptidase [Bacteroidales bacterium]|nr:C40 family peptidase [Bacteroidales bacterium]
MTHPFAITLQPLVPLRADASHRSEMVSQLLFGETCALLHGDEEWLRVRCCYDGYEGWVDAKQLYPLTAEQAQEVEAWPLIVSSPMVTISITSPSLFAGETTLAPMAIPMGSRLPQAHRHTLGNITIEHSVEPMEASPLLTFNKAFELINAPYLWGGKSLMGIDCSGFTQTVFKLYGIPLLRDASQQATQGIAVPSLAESQRGDLLFFANSQGRIVHVGIKFGPDTIIHASGNVRIDKVDAEGIFRTDQGRYTHHLHSIRRIHTTL